MAHATSVMKFSISTIPFLMLMAFVVTGVVGASEVTGTLSGGTSASTTITGTVGDVGSIASGTIGGTSGSTVTGTVSSGGSATSGGGGGGSTLGFSGGGITNPEGIVLGASTEVPSLNTGGGSVLGTSTNVPNTGSGGGAMITLLLILTLSLLAGLGTYAVSRRVMR